MGFVDRTAQFALGALDLASTRQRLRERGRARVEGFLDPSSAQALKQRLRAEKNWNLVTTLGSRHYDLDGQSMEDQAADQKAEFSNAVHAPAREGRFQYLFNNIPIYDNYHKRRQDRPHFNALFEFLNSDAVLTAVRDLVGVDDIGFADAQATRYLPGHFLTVHDDGVEGKGRRAAFVLSMSESWRPDWGGLTLFFRDDGQVDEAFVPAFNTLALFKVPQKHAVSVVAPFAGAPRFAITGWFRAGKDPAL